jgi:hypothetical protein
MGGTILAALVAETPAAGLSSAEVAQRRSRGLGNEAGERTSRSVAEILRANILTRFNFILAVLLAVILVAGQPQDALFGIVLVSNALIGIGQELRAKLTLDRLAVLSTPRVQVIRDGTAQEIAVAELVAGDLVHVRPGDQLAADGVVRTTVSLQADESLLTGESEPVDKRAGDRLLSGSFVVAGSGSYQATEVGAAAYARKLAAEARRFTLVRSELPRARICCALTCARSSRLPAPPAAVSAAYPGVQAWHTVSTSLRSLAARAAQLRACWLLDDPSYPTRIPCGLSVMATTVGLHRPHDCGHECGAWRCRCRSRRHQGECWLHRASSGGRREARQMTRSA